MSNLDAKAAQLRKDILNVSYEAKACHIGSALSCVEIMLAIMDVKGDDVFLFSKASGAAIYYCILANQGMFPREKTAEYLKNYPLCHKDVPGIIHSVGSIGHGLNVACGIAYADRIKDVYVLISDGELNEGSTWEALLFAGHHKLTNLKIICDYNGIQACGKTQDILKLDPIVRKLDGFDLDVVEADGHDFEQLHASLERTGPLFVVANTTKGKGVDYMEDRPEWHYKNLSPELLNIALCQI